MTLERRHSANGRVLREAERIIGYLLVGILALGCNKSTYEGSEAQPDEPAATAGTRAEAVTATKNAARDLHDYAYAQKSELVLAAKRELADMQADLVRLHTTIERSSGAARADAEAKLQAATDKWAAAKEQLDQVEAATEARWEDAQNRYGVARNELKGAVDDTRKWLSERIEP